MEDDLRHQLPAKARRHGQMNPRRVRVAEVMECQGGVVRDDGLRLARTVMAQQRQDDEVCTQGIIAQAKHPTRRAFPVAIVHVVMLPGIGVAGGERLLSSEVPTLMGHDREEGCVFVSVPRHANTF